MIFLACNVNALSQDQHIGRKGEARHMKFSMLHICISHALQCGTQGGNWIAGHSLWNLNC